MYVADALPAPLPVRWDSYYEYTYDALRFIKTVISLFRDNRELMKCVNMCLKYPNICLNAIEYPRF